MFLLLSAACIGHLCVLKPTVSWPEEAFALSSELLSPLSLKPSLCTWLWGAPHLAIQPGLSGPSGPAVHASVFSALVIVLGETGLKKDALAFSWEFRGAKVESVAQERDCRLCLLPQTSPQVPRGRTAYNHQQHNTTVQCSHLILGQSENGKCFIQIGNKNKEKWRSLWCNWTNNDLLYFFSVVWHSGSS